MQGRPNDERLSHILPGLLLAGLLCSTSASAATQVRIMWYSDGNEGEVIADLIKRFEGENPEIDVVLDNVSYSVIKEQLPVQLEAGRGPDIVRATDIKTLAAHWLDLRPMLADAAAWDANYGDYLDWMRPEGSNAIPGFMTQLTVTGPFVNKTLFEQAGVEMPGEKATWDDWAAAAREVAEKTEVPIPLAIDRSGHRFMGPAISMGAKVIGDDGMPILDDPGFRKMAEKVIGWHEDGTMSKELWGRVSGTTYAGANEEFANAEVVMYMSGSWQVGQFAEQIGDAFDWWAVPNPCGDAACSGMPGGAALVGVKYTQHPEEVTKVLEYLGSEPVLREFTERTLFVPAHKGLAGSQLDYQSESPLVQHALEVFIAETKHLAPVAVEMQAYKYQSAVYGPTISRLGQVVAGEMSLDDALVRIKEDVTKQIGVATR